jgi:hypothetical protein
MPLRAVSMLAVWMLLTGSAFASPPPTVLKSPIPNPIETTSPQKVTPRKDASAGKGPIIVNWHLKNGLGSANLLLNPDGTYLFSGIYKRKEPGKILDLVLALRSRVGATYIFEYMGNVSDHGVQWSKSSKNTILKEDFKLFASDVDWRGTYGFHLTKEAAKLKLINEKQNCADIQGWVNAGFPQVVSSYPEYCKLFGYSF